MRGVNKAILIGHLGQDPELRYMANGTPVCNLSLATTERWKDKDGQDQERTEWHRIVLYRRLAEIAGEYLAKGAQVYVEGRISTRKWQDKDGFARHTTEIIGDQLQMLGSRPGAAAVPPRTRAEASREFQAPAGGQPYDDDIAF